MSHAALHSLMQALMWKAAPIIILCGIVVLLVREALQWFERSTTRGLHTHRSGGKAEWTHHIQSGKTEASEAPLCPSCNVAMVKREMRENGNPGPEFWGCPNYPECQKTRALG